MSCEYEIESKLSNISSQLDSLIFFLKEHEELIKSHLNDYIVKDLNSFSCAASESDFCEKCKQVGKVECCFDSKYGNCHKYCRKVIVQEEKDLKVPNYGENQTINKKRNTFLSIKKNHEIDAMTLSIYDMSKYTMCKNIVDIGSGKGYLGNRLSDIADLSILGIEGSLGCSHSAKNRQLQMEKLYLKNDNKPRVSTLTYQMSRATIDDSECFVEMVKDNISEDNCAIEHIDGAVLVGLHACGDLTAYTLKLFVKEPYFKGLQIVGCCYNLCTENSEDVRDAQFPLSECVKQKNVHLGKNARMLACQSPEKWEATCQVLQISLLYRSILQKIVADKKLDDVLGNVKFRGIGKKSNSFEEYLVHVYKYMRPDDVNAISSDADEYYERYSCCWHDMQKFHWLRMQLAPCIERLIILDRLCYLLECGFHNATVVKLFSPSVSPRCYALLCERLG